MLTRTLPDSQEALLRDDHQMSRRVEADRSSFTYLTSRHFTSPHHLCPPLCPYPTPPPTSLTHVDLSWNSLTESACAALGAALLDNEASRVTGLHMDGNAAFVDSEGFIRARRGCASFQVPIHADILSFPRVPRLPQCTCWICGQWSPHTLTFVLQPGAIVGDSTRPLEPDDEVIVTVHLSVDT